jgi:hypothetical protein
MRRSDGGMWRNDGFIGGGWSWMGDLGLMECAEKSLNVMERDGSIRKSPPPGFAMEI